MDINKVSLKIFHKISNLFTRALFDVVFELEHCSFLDIVNPDYPRDWDGIGTAGDRFLQIIQIIAKNEHNLALKLYLKKMYYLK